MVNAGVYLEAAFQAARRQFGPGPLVARDCLVLRGLDLRDGPRPPPAPGGLDPANPPARLGLQTTGPEFYRSLWRRRLYLGAAARWVDHVWHTEGEALARMRPPRPGEADPYLLHPGLADAMLQVLFACLPGTERTDAVYALVGVERVVLHDYDPARPAYTHVTLRPGTDPASLLVARVDLLDDAGRPMVTLEGVNARPAARPAGGHGLADRPALAVPTTTGATPAAGPAAVLQPVLLPVL